MPYLSLFLLFDRFAPILPTQVCQVVVSEDFLSYIQSDCLAIEIWGHRSKGFGDGMPVAMPPGGEVIPAEALVSNRSKTLQERCVAGIS